MKCYRYFTLGKDIFAGIFDLYINSDDDITQYHEILPRSYDLNYIKRRMETEQKLFSLFKDKGGKPQKNHPYYLTLGNCDRWFFGERHCFGSLIFNLDEFDPDTISFTYGDSIPTFMDEFDDGKEYRRQVYTLSEIKELIRTYGYPQEWNPLAEQGPENYIEVQVWSDDPIIDCRPDPHTGLYSCIHTIASRMMRAKGLSIENQRSFDACVALSKSSPLWPWFRRVLAHADPSSFQPNPVHGFEHALKCALIGFVLAAAEGLDETETKTLVLAGLYHDIGRKYYERGRSHGQIGADKVTAYVDPEEQIPMDELKDAIRYHDVPDHKLPAMSNTLLRLKDLDTLDYLRLGFGIYDPSILRTSEAGKLVRFALELNIRLYLQPDAILTFIQE